MAVSLTFCRRISAKLLSNSLACLIKPRIITARCFNAGKSADTDLWKAYATLKEKVLATPLKPDKDPKNVFANNELDLSQIEVFGFDYDYTLACYKPGLADLIYHMGCQALISEYKYPKEIADVPYDPDFAVRGLHCDVKKGFLLKIDSFHNIQMGTVYRGLQRVPDDEVKDHYHGTHVPIENISNFYGTGQRMHQLMDLFALPEMTLFTNVIEYMNSKDIPYDPEYIFYDVKHAVQGLHQSGQLHQHIMNNMDEYLGNPGDVAQLLHRLKSAGKAMFLITNSGVKFVDSGMEYLLGPDWHQLFDVVITNARKPKFFHDTNRPFREYDCKQQVKKWKRVDKFKKGHFYQEGNFYKLGAMTGWYGNKVLYFGDHVYTDLADATLKHGWRTGAIIPELEKEMKILNSSVYKESVEWLVALEDLISTMQVHTDVDSQAIMEEWIDERNSLRQTTKEVFNPRFGSLFRTFHNSTYFTRRLNRFADVYMSSVSCLLGYSLDHTFYPRRSALPHEHVVSQ